MADIVKLKKKAADHEAKKQNDKALEVYREILDAYEAGEEDSIDIPLYNRVGDLLQKVGNLAEAVSVWEKAVDHYAEGGFYNPAIALCNKILRASPGRTVIYYKLGKIHAEKGFRGDARQNFLEYAARQQKGGNLDEAFRALKEFADLVPDQHDVRLMLADQLVKAARKDEAIAQLQLGYAQATSDGNDGAARDIAAKMKEIDPSVEPKADGPSSASGGGGLVFLDVEGSSAPGARKLGRTTAEVKRITKAVEGLELLEPPVVSSPKRPTLSPSATPAAKQPEPKPAPTPEPVAPPAPSEPVAPPEAAQPISSPEPSEPVAPPEAAQPAAELLIEPTDVGADAPPPPRGSISGLETTNLTEEAEAVADVPLIEVEPTLGGSDAPAADDLGLLEVEPSVPNDLPLLEPEPTLSSETSFLEGTAGSDQSFDLLEVEPSVGNDLPLLGDAPTEEPEAAEPAPAAGLDLPLLEEEPATAEIHLIEVALPDSAPRGVDELRARVAESPDDWTARRLLAEAMLEAGTRAEAIVELEAAMTGFEHAGDLDTAGSIAEEIVRLEPKSIRFHQKRVEFAFRANDRARLAEAYVELADALLADGQAQKARAVYQRVLDITPDDLRAQAAIESIPVEEEAPTPAPRRSTHAPARPSPSKPTPTPAADKGDDDYVSLGDWLREDDEPKSTRMVVEEQEPTGDEQADFNDMLRKFKQGVSENVDEGDHEAHYDLGVAFKEMGLLDEAIAEFQKALRGTKERVRTFEALGHCFVEKGQLPVAATIMQRALAEPGVRDEALVGVLYLLGAVAEEQGQFPEAKKFYERVFAVDIQFRDVGDRLNAVEQRLT